MHNRLRADAIRFDESIAHCYNRAVCLPGRCAVQVILAPQAPPRDRRMPLHARS